MDARAKVPWEVDILVEQDIPVPQCLQNTDDLFEQIDAPVILPPRFLKMAKNDIPKEKTASEEPETRERDIEYALRWLRQEMMLLRRDDIQLMKKFLDLRASMMELKWVLETHGSTSDGSSYYGSNVSLDDVISTDYYVLAEEDNMEFRARTTSLLTPRKTRVTRIKWKSNEII